MKCNETREVMPDLAAGLTSATPAVKAHLDSCAECTGKLEAFRNTMNLMDEWQAPEPSPYFDVRLRARLREESEKQSVGWLRWLRKPVLAASFALMMVVSVSLVRMNSGEKGSETATSLLAVVPQAAAEPGTAVGDLQSLEKNQSLYSDFDVLDDLAVQPDVTATP